jgi:hypothetical protein
MPRQLRLIQIAPEFVTELEYLLIQRGEAALANQASDLLLVERCRCGDIFCGSFYTAPPPVSPNGPGRRTIPLSSDIGILTVDVIGSEIVHVEILYRDDLRGEIIAAMVCN